MIPANSKRKGKKHKDNKQQNERFGKNVNCFLHHYFTPHNFITTQAGLQRSVIIPVYRLIYATFMDGLPGCIHGEKVVQ